MSDYNDQEENKEFDSQQQPQNQPYQYQQNQQPSSTGSNAMSIASMVLGILGIISFCNLYISIPSAIAGLVLGIICIRNNKRSRGMAIAGIITSAIAIAIALLVIMVMVLAYSNPELSNMIDEYNMTNQAY